MTPDHHPACNDVLKRPHGMTEEQCLDLPIYRQTAEDGGHSVSSFWKPGPEELEALNNGDSIILHITGVTHPPLSIGACHAVHWEYEDQLGEIPSEQYDSMFPLSRVISGVRMFPYIIADSEDGHPQRHYLA